MAAIEEISPAAGPVSTRPPEDEIDDDEDEDVSSICRNGNDNKSVTQSRCLLFLVWPFSRLNMLANRAQTKLVS